MEPAKLPQSLDSERAILGAILLDNAAWKQASSLDPADLTLDSHRRIFTAMRELFARQVPVDLVTLHEYLHETGDDTQVGGAAYLSSLTDGLPKVANITHYVRIVRKKARERRILQATNAVGAAILEGQEPDPGAAAVLAQLASGPESKNGSEPAAPVTIFPTVPEEAWCPVSRVYWEAVRYSTSASPAYHLSVFIAIAGMMLGRTCYFRLAKRCYPNFFVALVGRAGKAKKGTAMDYGVDLLQDAAPSIPWASSVDSAEGLVNFLSNGQKEHETKDAPGLVYFSELRGLIEKSGKKESGGGYIITKLSEAFDCGRRLEILTKNNPLRVNYPFVTVLGAASPTWLDKLNMSDLEGGLGSRFLWIPANPIDPYDDPPPINQQLWNSVVQALGEARKYWAERKESEFHFTPAAKALWTPWFSRLWKSLSHDPLIEVVGERMDLQCKKIAMVYSAIERREPVIDVAHLKPAMRFTEFAVECLYRIFSDFGLTDAVKRERRILEAVEAAMPAGITQRELQRRAFGSRLDSETLSRTLRWMIGEDAPLHVIKHGSKSYLFLNDWTGPATENPDAEPTP